MSAESHKLLIQQLVRGLEKDYKHYNGWTFSWDYPGYFCYSRARTEITALPDDKYPFIRVHRVVNSTTASSREYEIFYRGKLTPRKFFEALKPDLVKKRVK